MDRLHLYVIAGVIGFIHGLIMASNGVFFWESLFYWQSLLLVLIAIILGILGAVTLNSRKVKR